MLIDLKEYGVPRNRLSSYAPWFGLVAPGVVLNTDGSFQKTYSFRGRDMDSSTDYEQLNIMATVNNIIKRLGAGWAFYIEADRHSADDYADRDFPDKITWLMDVERRNYFSGGHHFESDYFLTLQWIPSSDTASKAASIFYSKERTAATKEEEYCDEVKAGFIAACNRFYDAFREATAECRPLTDGETLSYLHSCVSSSARQKVGVPPTPAFLAELLCDTPMNGGMEPSLGEGPRKEYLAVISILSFPSYSCPGMLDALNRLDLEYRWCTRYICLDKNDADNVIRKLRREWFSGHKSLFTMIKETITKSESAMVETVAIQRSQDAEEALNELANDYVRFGYMSSCLVLRDGNLKTLEVNARKVVQAFESKGFVVSQEGLNAVGAWFGTLPGNAYSNVRRPMLSTLNLCHLLPLSAVWAGESWCGHLDGPALMHTQTDGSTPFRFNLHIGDVGHSMVVGPTGSGKSVFLNFLCAQCRSFEGARVFIFDKGGSSRVLAAGVGGAFYDLGNEADVDGQSFQPLRHVDQEDEKIWASEWLQQLYIQEGVSLTPDHRKDIWQALISLASTPPGERTLFGFWNLVQNMELRNAILPFVSKVEGVTDGGPYGRLFDADKDTLKLGGYQAFEMGELMNKKNAVMPTLLYLFHIIERSCDGSPTFIILDECWTFLDNPIFAEKIREWLKTMRKNNVSIVFATQNLADIRNCSISSAIIESCMTRIFLPNANALNPADTEIYSYFGLNDTERDILSKAIPKRHYYYKSPLGSRLFELALSPFALSYVAASSKEDQAECVRIQTAYPGEDFNVRWLKHKGQAGALAAYLEQ